MDANAMEACTGQIYVKDIWNIYMHEPSANLLISWRKTRSRVDLTLYNNISVPRVTKVKGSRPICDEVCIENSAMRNKIYLKIALLC